MFEVIIYSTTIKINLLFIKNSFTYLLSKIMKMQYTLNNMIVALVIRIIINNCNSISESNLSNTRCIKYNSKRALLLQAVCLTNRYYHPQLHPYFKHKSFSVMTLSTRIIVRYLTIISNHVITFQNVHIFFHKIVKS